MLWRCSILGCLETLLSRSSCKPSQYCVCYLLAGSIGCSEELCRINRHAELPKVEWPLENWAPVMFKKFSVTHQ
jgi:hypothetical protein